MNDSTMAALLQSTIQKPEVASARPDELISKVMEELNIADLDPVTPEEAAEVLKTYFQAIVLDKDEWTQMPTLNGISKWVQIHKFRLKKLPDDCHLVADVMIDKSDFEEQCFRDCVTKMEVRGKSVIFYAPGPLPVNVTLGLKCINSNGDVVLPTEEDYQTKKK